MRLYFVLYTGASIDTDTIVPVEPCQTGYNLTSVQSLQDWMVAHRRAPSADDVQVYDLGTPVATLDAAQPLPAEDELPRSSTKKTPVVVWMPSVLTVEEEEEVVEEEVVEEEVVEEEVIEVEDVFEEEVVEDAELFEDVEELLDDEEEVVDYDYEIAEIPAHLDVPVITEDILVVVPPTNSISNLIYGSDDSNDDDDEAEDNAPDAATDGLTKQEKKLDKKEKKKLKKEEKKKRKSDKKLKKKKKRDSDKIMLGHTLVIASNNNKSNNSMEKDVSETSNTSRTLNMDDPAGMDPEAAMDESMKQWLGDMVEGRLYEYQERRNSRLAEQPKLEAAKRASFEAKLANNKGIVACDKIKQAYLELSASEHERHRRIATKRDSERKLNIERDRRESQRQLYLQEKFEESMASIQSEMAEMEAKESAEKERRASLKEAKRQAKAEMERKRQAMEERKKERQVMKEQGTACLAN